MSENAHVVSGLKLTVLMFHTTVNKAHQTKLIYFTSMCYKLIYKHHVKFFLWNTSVFNGALAHLHSREG